MSDMKTSILISLVPLLLMCGCVNLREDACPAVEDGQAGEGTACIELSFRTEDPVTRSTIVPDDRIGDMVSCVTVAAYDDRLLGTWHFEGDSPVVLFVPQDARAFYFVANMGDQSGNFPEWESQIPGFTYRINDFDAISEAGIPMCAEVVWDGNRSVVVPLERLFAKVRVTFEKDSSFINPGNGTNSLFLQNMYVRNANTLLFPFGKSMATDVSDVASESDCQAHFGTFPEQGGSDSFTAEFYVPENMMGTLLPSNTDPWNKTAENIVFGENDMSGRCTYIEIGAAGTYPIKGWVGQVKYRLFLGKDNVTNFDVCRNSVYDVTVVPDYDNLLRPSWKVNFSGSDLRSLFFTDEKCRIDGIPVYYFLKGTRNKVYLFYHRVAGGGASQVELYGEDWDYNADVEGLKEAGVVSSIIYGADKSPSDSRYVRNVVEFDVPATAGTGTYSISASTHDGLRNAVANIIVTDAVEWPMSFDWDIIPSYVGQYGILDISDVPKEVLPVRYGKVETADYSEESGDVVRLVPLNEECTKFKVTGCRQGKSVITFTNKDGDQASEVTINVRRPSLAMERTSYAYSLDITGTEKSVSYRICDGSGNMLANLDDAIVRERLVPVPVLDHPASAYFGVEARPEDMAVDVFVNHVNEAMAEYQNQAFPIKFNFRDCKGEPFDGFKVMFSLPVAEDVETCWGRIDDYSLLTYRPLRKQYCLENGIAYRGTDTYCTEPERYEFDQKSIYIGTRVASSVLPVNSVTIDGLTGQSYPGASRNFTTSYAFRGSWMRYDLTGGMSSLRIWPVMYYGIIDQRDGLAYYDKALGTSEEGFTSYGHVAGKKYVRFNYRNRHSGETVGIRQGYVELYVYGQLVWRRTEGAFDFGDVNFSSIYGSGYVMNGKVQQHYPFALTSAGGVLPSAGNVPCGLYPLFAYCECLGPMQDSYVDGSYRSLPLMDRRIRSKDGFLTDLGIGDYYVRFNRWVYYDISLDFAVPYRTTDKFADMMSENARIDTDCTGMFDAIYSELWSGTVSGALVSGADAGCVRPSGGTVMFAASDDNEKIVISNVLKSRHGIAMRVDGGCELYDPAIARHSRRGINNMLYRVIGFPGLDYSYLFSREKESHPASPGIYNRVLPGLWSYDGIRIMQRVNMSGNGKYGDRDKDGKSYYQIVSVLE